MPGTGNVRFTVDKLPWEKSIDFGAVVAELLTSAVTHIALIESL